MFVVAFNSATGMHTLRYKQETRVLRLRTLRVRLSGMKEETGVSSLPTNSSVMEITAGIRKFKPVTDRPNDHTLPQVVSAMTLNHPQLSFNEHYAPKDSLISVVLYRRWRFGGRFILDSVPITTSKCWFRWKTPRFSERCGFPRASCTPAGKRSWTRTSADSFCSPRCGGRS